MKEDPLVLCLTNTVAANFTANVLLALGAKPAMVEEPSEAEQLVAVSDAVLVNVGTVTASQAAVMRAAIAACRRHNVPWVLDPVASHLLTFRDEIVKEFLGLSPSLVRGNHAEINHLLGTGRPFPLLSTGERDRLYYPDGSVEEITGGVSMLQTVTATGCAQGAVCAALLGWGETPQNACQMASRLFKAAGERAFARAKSPGFFQAAFIDSVYELSPLRR